ncbi:DNA (cytosine-5)-methyltransferase 1 [Methanococcus maripaludis]|uniref:DNA (cytosine-5-)-methyltransferase n=1 Tax=Methanococcus maripaludis TaxID=39152 RepID=A0A7J9NJU6_METMI|nr:DNA cytosine methyltransferase [Methanococcus maripaludis]MBA2840871.1 DNA (cytosine-5)-methyltransferase 1 [Methanococcus maripaludis]
MTSFVNKWDKNIPVEKSPYIFESDYQILCNPKIKINNEFTMIDLFCGAGGFSVGGEWAGFQSILGLDYLKPAITTWKENHPNAISILGDITKINPLDIKKLTGGINIDLITAGVPCQGFSLANRKHNTEDKRNYLFLDLMRFIEVFNPKAVIIENVSALRSRGNGKFEKEILGALDTLGYSGVVKTLNAADYGVPQLRERVFFVGLKNGKEFEFPEGKFKNISRNQKIKDNKHFPYRTVYDAISDLPKIESHQSAEEYDEKPITDYQELMRGFSNILSIKKCDKVYNHVAPRHDLGTIEKIRTTEPGKPMYPKFKQRIRLSYDNPSPTQLAGGIRPQFQFGHPELNRGLTIRERARIQSFPDSYIFTGSVVQERVQTGNAVPPLLVYEILKELKKYLG